MKTLEVTFKVNYDETKMSEEEVLNALDEIINMHGESCPDEGSYLAYDFEGKDAE